MDISRVALIGLGLCALVLLHGCDTQQELKKEVPVIPATVITIEPQDTPVVFEFVGQAESSRQVEIRARVDGFLDKQTYNDGELVQDVHNDYA